MSHTDPNLLLTAAYLGAAAATAVRTLKPWLNFKRRIGESAQIDLWHVVAGILTLLLGGAATPDLLTGASLPDSYVLAFIVAFLTTLLMSHAAHEAIDKARK